MAVILLFSFSFKVLAGKIEITKEKVIQLVNESRRAEGLETLKENEKLSLAASQKAEDMIKKKYFAHNSPDGITPWSWIEKSGYNYRYAGENLAIDFKDAESQHTAWMKSPTHRKNILNSDFQEIGVAVKEGVIEGHLATITVQEFGLQMGAISRNTKEKVSAVEAQKENGEVETAKNSEVMIEEKKFPEKQYLSQNFQKTDWAGVTFISLQALIMLIIFLVNPVILIFLALQIRNFKKSGKTSELELKKITI